MALFTNPSKSNFIVAGFVALLILFFSCEGKAETTMEIGGTFLNAKYSGGQTLILTERWGDKWSIGMGVIGEQIDKYDREISNNLVFFALRNVRGRGAFESIILGVGPVYLGNTTTVNGTNLNIMLSLEYNKTRKSIFPDYIIIRHISNAGSMPPNTGQDMINFGYSFGK